MAELRILKSWGLYQDRYYAIIDREDFFRKSFQALSFNGIEGDYVEFGTGPLTFPLAFRESRKVGYDCRLWAFDSFQGLPARKTAHDEHLQWRPGRFSIGLDEFHAMCRRNHIPPSIYRAVPGLFEDTLKTSKDPSNICFAYVDCDMYSSALSVLQFLKPRLKHGMILAFDDYFCWSKDEPSGERMACMEIFHDEPDWILVPYIQYGSQGLSFLVERRRYSKPKMA